MSDMEVSAVDVSAVGQRSAGGRPVALDLAVTIHSDGAGGVKDSLVTIEDLAAWLTTQGRATLERCELDAELLRRVRRSRRAIRALLSDLTGAPRTGLDDAGQPFGVADAVAILNADARQAPTAVELIVSDGTLAARRQRCDVAPSDLLLGDLADSAVALLTGPDRLRVRACPAPRCVRYFLRQHSRQEWCKPSCGNRVRAARHYRRHRG